MATAAEAWNWIFESRAVRLGFRSGINEDGFEWDRVQESERFDGISNGIESVPSGFSSRIDGDGVRWSEVRDSEWFEPRLIAAT